MQARRRHPTGEVVKSIAAKQVVRELSGYALNFIWLD